MLLFCHSNKESNGHIVNLRLSSVTRNLQLQVPSFPCLSPCLLPHHHLNFILCRCQLHARYRIRCREAHTQCGIVFSDDPMTFPSFKFKTEKGCFRQYTELFFQTGIMLESEAKSAWPEGLTLLAVSAEDTLSLGAEPRASSVMWVL